MRALQGWELELVEGLRVARLGTIAASGQPHLVPVCYALVDEEIAIAIDEKPKRDGTLARVRNIEGDPRVTLLFDRYSDDWEQLAWVRLEGQASVVPRGSEWPRALERLRQRYRQYETMTLEERPVVRIRPGRIVSWRWAG